MGRDGQRSRRLKPKGTRHYIPDFFKRHERDDFLSSLLPLEPDAPRELIERHYKLERKCLDKIVAENERRLHPQCRWAYYADHWKPDPPPGWKERQEAFRQTLLWPQYLDDRRFGHHFGWRGRWHRDGRPIFSVKGRNLNAREYAWRTLVGPVPEGAYLRPVCGDSRCMNVRHLRPVFPATPTTFRATIRREWDERDPDPPRSKRVTIRSLAEKHRLSRSAIHRILSEKSRQFDAEQARRKPTMVGAKIVRWRK